jgi:hypothetical protein
MVDYQVKYASHGSIKTTIDSESTNRKSISGLAEDLERTVTTFPELREEPSLRTNPKSHLVAPYGIVCTLLLQHAHAVHTSAFCGAQRM